MGERTGVRSNDFENENVRQRRDRIDVFDAPWDSE
jgi:hypothetical protein